MKNPLRYVILNENKNTGGNMSKKKGVSKKSDKKFRRLFCAVLFLLSFAICFSVTMGGILLSAYWENIRAQFSHERWTYTVGLEEDDNYSSRSISDAYVYVDGILYLNMTDIALMCDMTVVGDFNSLTYFPIDNSEQTATFYFDSDKITVNGEHYKMNGPMFKVPAASADEQDDIYIPASFVSRFCSGIILEFDDDARTLHLYRHSLAIEYDPLNEPYHVYEDVTFLTGNILPVEMPDRGLMFSSQNKDVTDER